MQAIHNLSYSDKVGSQSASPLPEHASQASTNRHAKQLSIIYEADEDQDAKTPRSTAAETVIMLVQALLVDASTTLCAYLYHSSIQGRMAAQEQATRTAIAAICSHLPSAADAAAKALCIENLTAENPALAHTSLASLGRWVLCLTAIKFMFGFALMTKYAGRIQPFDLLIISGAAHCLALYCMFFAPYASHLVPVSDALPAQYWLALLSNFFWIMMMVSAAMLACNIVADIIRDSRPAIRLEDDAQSLNGDAEKC